jgi:hypothetical protein
VSPRCSCEVACAVMDARFKVGLALGTLANDEEKQTWCVAPAWRNAWLVHDHALGPWPLVEG